MAGSSRAVIPVSPWARTGRWRAPDLVKRDFPAAAVNVKWYGDGTDIDTDEGKLYLDSVLDVGSRRVLGFALASTTTRSWATARW